MAEANGHQPAWQKLAEFLKKNEGRVLVLVAERGAKKVTRGTALAPRGRFKVVTTIGVKSACLDAFDAVVAITALGAHKHFDGLVNAAEDKGKSIFRGLKTSGFNRACREAFAGKPKEEPVAGKPAEVEVPKRRTWVQLTGEDQDNVLQELGMRFDHYHLVLTKCKLGDFLKEYDLALSTTQIWKRDGFIEKVPTGKTGPAGKWQPGKELLPLLEGKPPSEQPPPTLSALEELALVDAEHASRVAGLKKRCIEEQNLELDVVLKERAVVAARCRELDEKEKALRAKIEELEK